MRLFFEKRHTHKRAAGSSGVYSAAIVNGRSSSLPPFLWVLSGKAVKEDGTAAEAKEAPSGDVEVKTVPSEAPQMNGNESKA